MKVLSLYDGMACGMLAMQKAEIPVEDYFAYEIDKYAVKTAQHNFPGIQELGDVFREDYTKYEGQIDYLIGGSPCTYWSIAQSPDKRETTSSGVGWDLFSQYVRALREAKPKYFIYENNKSMARAIYEAISETFGFEPIMINSALVSAQNRQRYYWVGKRNEDGSYSKVDVSQPEDRGILLKDVLDRGVDLTANRKAYTLTASYNGAVAWNTLERSQRNMVAEPINTISSGKSQCLRATCYKDGIRNIAGNIIDRKTGVAEPVCVASRGRYVDTDSRSIKSDCGTYQHLEAREDGKTNALTTVSKDNLVAQPTALQEQPYGRAKNVSGQYDRRYEAKTDGKSPALTSVESRRMLALPIRCFTLPRKDGVQTESKQYRVYETKGKSTTLCAEGGGMGAKTGLYAVPVEVDENGEPTKAVSCTDGKTYTVYKVEQGLITIKDKTYPIKLHDGYYIIRKLTVSECKRLQTVPEWYEFPVSNTQAYKMLGNGWTVEVIAHLINATKNT